MAEVIRALAGAIALFAVRQDQKKKKKRRR